MQAGDPVAGAIVRVEERAKDMVTSSQGEFWRLLTPGGNYFCTSNNFNRHVHDLGTP